MSELTTTTTWDGPAAMSVSGGPCRKPSSWSSLSGPVKPPTCVGASGAGVPAAGFAAASSCAV
jgi:hypothetical protein